LLRALFESIDAEALPQRGLRLVAAPRGAWRQFFESLVLERETRLELATLALARKPSNSVFERVQKWPLEGYLPLISMGIHAECMGSHADARGHADHKLGKFGEAVDVPRRAATSSSTTPRLSPPVVA
jgi:hypothetical protein